jgi:cyclophilin family peptidyl-prolyl cis-trans isomerase
VTFLPTSWLNGKHVVFGMIEKGFEICAAIEKLKCNGSDVPSMQVKITDCGEIKPAPREEKKKEERVEKKVVTE